MRGFPGGAGLLLWLPSSSETPSASELSTQYVAVHEATGRFMSAATAVPSPSACLCPCAPQCCSEWGQQAMAPPSELY